MNNNDRNAWDFTIIAAGLAAGWLFLIIIFGRAVLPFGLGS